MTVLTTIVGQRTDTGRSTARALGVAAGAMVGVLAIYVVFVRSGFGQSLDARAAYHLAYSLRAGGVVESWLRDVSVVATASALGACILVALLRGRPLLAVLAVVLVAGANLTTQVLKHVVLQRPDLGHGTVNSLPSGHTTVVTSIALAAILVTPRALRSIVSLVGAVVITFVGVGTVVAAWHRPSDVLAALFVCLAWGALVAAVLSMREVPPPLDRVPRSHPFALLVGMVLAAGFFVWVGVRPQGADFVIHAVIMCGLALAGAVVVGLFTRLVDARSA